MIATTRNEEKRKPEPGALVCEKLEDLYPKVETSLLHEDPFQLLIATMLSAQSTDAQINKVTPKLFEKFPDANSMAKASLRQLENIVKSTGYFHVKSKRIKEVSQVLLRKFNGTVPDSMEELTELPGVGRKTANIVLSAGYGKVEGIAVDTHVFRVSRRIGLAKSNTPEKVEEELMQITPRELWPRLSMLLIFHGRAVCDAKKPQCSSCVLSSQCLFYRQEKK